MKLSSNVKTKTEKKKKTNKERERKKKIETSSAVAHTHTHTPYILSNIKRRKIRCDAIRSCQAKTKAPTRQDEKIKDSSSLFLKAKTRDASIHLSSYLSIYLSIGKKRDSGTYLTCWPVLEMKTEQRRRPRATRSARRNGR